MASSLRRRHVLGGLAGSAALAASAGWPSLVRAQGRTLRIIVGFPAGGGTDAIARLLGERLKDELRANVIVENKPGAGGQLAAQALKASPPDGNTLFISHDHTISILPLVSKNPGFDPARDFTPVVGFASFVNAFAVSPGTPAKSMQEYADWVKTAGQGKGAVGVPAPASTPEFLVKVVAERYKLDLVAAPYRGSAPMIGDMLGNQIAAGIGSVPEFLVKVIAQKYGLDLVAAPYRGSAPMMAAEDFASCDTARIFCFIFLRSRSTLERLFSASERLPPVFDWIAMTMPRKFTSESGMRSYMRSTPWSMVIPTR